MCIWWLPDTKKRASYPRPPEDSKSSSPDSGRYYSYGVDPGTPKVDLLVFGSFPGSGMR